jgi:Tfp pilus assembly protein PilO
MVSFLASLGLLVATILVFSFLLRPSYADVNQLRGELESRSELLESQKDIVEKVQKLLGEYQSVAGLKQNISLVLPNKEDYPTLFNQIDGLSRSSGMQLEGVNVSVQPSTASAGAAGANVPRVGIIQLNLSLSGPYQAFKSFIQALETNMRIMDVVSISVNPGTGAAQNYSYSIVVNAYYQTL